MALFRRRGERSHEPPPDTAQDLPAPPGFGPNVGRVLAWSPLVGGGWAVATPTGLRAFLPTCELIDRPWTEVDHVTWDQDCRMLAIWWVGSRHATPLELEDEKSFLPEAVHERVRSSMVLSMDVEVPGGRSVRVALRKAGDGTLSTQAIPGRGVRMSDPQVAAAVTQARHRLREEAGLEPDS